MDVLSVFVDANIHFHHYLYQISHSIENFNCHRYSSSMKIMGSTSSILAKLRNFCSFTFMLRF